VFGVQCIGRRFIILPFAICDSDPEARVRFPALPKKVVGLKRGPLSLVSSTEELLVEK
jgi:hypothetical protein